MRCLTCQYDLSNLTEHRCPECGRAFDPSDPRTYATSRRAFSGRRIVQLALVAYILTLAYVLFVAVLEQPGNTKSLLLSPLYAAILATIFTFPIFLIAYLIKCFVVRMVHRRDR